MSKKYEYLGGRTVTVRYLGEMSNEEFIDSLACIIAKKIHQDRQKEQKKGDE